MAIDYTLTQGDVGKVMTGTLYGADGIAVSLSTATAVLFTLALSRCTDDPTIDEAPAVADPDQATHLGKAGYTYVAGDTDVPGDYLGWFTVEWGAPATTRLTFPTNPLRIRINRKGS